MLYPESVGRSAVTIVWKLLSEAPPWRWALQMQGMLLQPLLAMLLRPQEAAEGLLLPRQAARLAAAAAAAVAGQHQVKADDALEVAGCKMDDCEKGGQEESPARRAKHFGVGMPASARPHAALGGLVGGVDRPCPGMETSTKSSPVAVARVDVGAKLLCLPQSLSRCLLQEHRRLLR